MTPKNDSKNNNSSFIDKSKGFIAKSGKEFTRRMSQLNFKTLEVFSNKKIEKGQNEKNKSFEGTPDAPYEEINVKRETPFLNQHS